MAVERSRGQDLGEPWTAGPASPAGRASAAHPSRSVDRVYDALRSVVRGGASDAGSARPRAVAPCLSLGIRAMSTWPESPAPLEPRRVAGMAELPVPPVHGVDRPTPAVRRVVIGQSLTVWDAGER